MDSPNPPSAKPAPPPRENLWANLAFNIAIPVLLMTTGQTRLGLKPLPALFIALAFPLGYGIYDKWRRRKWNFLSLLGMAGLLLTGGIGLFHLSPQWVAVKDAAIPLALGIAVLASLAMKRPLAQTLLLNPELVDVARLEAALTARQAHAAFRQLLNRATLLVAASFFLSGVLNYILARMIVKSESGTPEFTAELGHMTAVSMPVIVVPSFLMMGAALWMMLSGLKKLTGLEIDDMFHPEPAKVEKK